MNRQVIEEQFPTLTWHFERSHGFEEILETAINKMDIQALLELGRNYENFKKYYYMLMNEWERSQECLNREMNLYWTVGVKN